MRRPRRPAFAALIALAALVVALLGARAAEAHGMRTAYVEVRETAPGRALVALRAQAPVTGLALGVDAPCTMGDAPDDAGAARALTCPESVGGATLRVEGLGAILAEAVVWTSLADGTAASSLVTRERPWCRLPRAGTAWPAVAREYVGLGLRHILTGVDHLLFLVGLVVVQRRARAVLLAETAFTLSHSLTFSANALGWVRVASAPVEACIALSLVLVAREAARARREGEPAPRARAGAGLAFVFGLVHGLGFAGGLAEIGLPERAIPAALAGFAGGVEVGQVAFLAAVLAAFALARRASERVPRAAGAEVWLARASTYAVGGVGFFWLIARVHALLWTGT